MAQDPPRHVPKTIKQAKADYKKQSGPKLTTQQLRHLSRELELDERARKIREREKRKKEAAQKRKAKEELDRKNRKINNVTLATQLAGFSHTQTGLKRKMEAWVGLRRDGEPAEKEIQPEIRETLAVDDEFDEIYSQQDHNTTTQPQDPKPVSTFRASLSSIDNEVPRVSEKHFLSQKAERPPRSGNAASSIPRPRTVEGGDYGDANNFDLFDDENFDLVADADLLNALAFSENSKPLLQAGPAIPSQPNPQGSGLGLSPGTTKFLIPGSFEAGEKQAAVNSVSPPHSVNRVEPSVCMEIEDIPDDFWVTSTQLERELQVAEEDTQRKVSSAEEFGSSIPWELLEGVEVAANLYMPNQIHHPSISEDGKGRSLPSDFEPADDDFGDIYSISVSQQKLLLDSLDDQID